MKKRLSGRETLLLRVFMIVLASSLIALGATYTISELIRLKGRIIEEQGFIETIPPVDQRKLTRLTKAAAEQGTRESAQPRNGAELSLITLGEHVRSIARGIPVVLSAYTQNEEESRISISGEADPEGIVSLLTEIDATQSSLAFAGASINRIAGATRFRFTIELETGDGVGRRGDSSLISHDEVLSLFGYRPPVQEPLEPVRVAEPSVPVRRNEDPPPESLPIEYVGEAVVGGTTTVFLKHSRTGRLIVLRYGNEQSQNDEYLLQKVEVDHVQIVYQEHVYRISKN